MKSLILLLPIILLACNKQPEQSATHNGSIELGTLKHQFNISPSAKIDFDKGLLLLHSFEYDDAQESFEAAIMTDTSEVMAYWGLAMTHYKALWGLQDVVAGRAVISKLGATEKQRLTKISDPLEKDFWQGIELLYGEGELQERNQKYADYMADLYTKYSDNQEVAAFYSLALMWASDFNDNEKLAASSKVAAGIIAENPNHPGALHYMIHANDNALAAKYAIEAANAYAKVAPAADHALHMPSHIYVAMGMWHEVVNSNIASYKASVERVKRKGLPLNERSFHAYAWLHYGLLQLEKYAEAGDMLSDMINFHREGTGADDYLIMMQNEQRIESGIWPETLTPVNVDYSNLGLESRVGHHFWKGLLAFDKNNLAGLKAETDTLYAHLEAAKLVVTDDGVALCSAGPTRYTPNKESILKTKAVIYQMEALQAQLKKLPANEVEQWLIKATEAESESQYDAGPPMIALPTYEQYGEWLLVQERWKDALIQFNKSLDNRSNRMKALKGKLKALEKLKHTEEYNEVKQLLEGYREKAVAVL